MLDRPRSSLPLPISAAQVTVLIVCVVSIYFVINFYGKSLETYRISQRAADVRRDIAQLEAEIQLLKAEVAYYQTDEYVELTARDKLSLARPGDRPVIVLPAEPTPVAEQPEEADAPAGAAGSPNARVPPDPELGYIPNWVAVFFAPRQ